MPVPTPPQNILGPLAAAATRYGIPLSIVEDIAYTESGYNAQAIGDQGSSFGLFQLHVSGQLPAQYNPPNQGPVFDPTLNTSIAMPAIARAWNNLKGSFNPNSNAWWQQFAAQSGHPGGSPGQAVTTNEAAKLQQYYTGNSTNDSQCSCPSGTIQIGGWCIGGAGAIAVPCSPGGTQQPISPEQVVTNNAVQGALSGVIGAILAPLEQAVTQAVPRIGLFIFGIILFVVGFLLLKG